MSEVEPQELAYVIKEQNNPQEVVENADVKAQQLKQTPAQTQNLILVYVRAMEHFRSNKNP